MTFKEKTLLIKRGIKITDGLDKGRVTRITANKILHTAQSFFHVFIVSNIIDMVAGLRPLKDTLTFTVITGIIELGIFIALQTLDRRISSHRFTYDTNSRKALWDKIINMDYVHIENPETYIMYHRAMQGIARMERFIHNFLECVSGVISVIAGVIIIAPLAFRSVPDTAELGGFMRFLSSPEGLLATVSAVALLEITRGLYNSKRGYKYISEMNNNRDILQCGRTAGYYLENITRNYRNGKDCRIYGEQELIQSEYEHNVKGRINGCKKALGHVYEINFVLGLLVMTSSIIMYGFAAARAISGILTVGEIVGFVMYFSRIRGGVSSVTNGIGNMSVDTEFVRKAMDFLDIPDEKYQGTIPTEKRDDNEYEFEFKHVWFKYPGSEQYVLKDINLKWKIGEKMALVGKNGCGKSTLIKLLCRLYDPTEGEITLNGINIKKYKYEDYMALFSVVFQGSQLFSFNIAENVAASEDYDSGLVKECVIKAGLGDRLSTLENGIETCLYKDFDEKGVEISGGEAQKLCLARAVYKGAPFIVLDEPTAALDPVSEHDIYTKFNGIVGTRTAIYISHRLSSCKFCDEITVMENGTVAERGKHKELLEKGGVYGKLWAAQAEYYRDSAGELFED